ncbi:MAG: hypothetical protein ACYTEQ_12385 [Planctomycetota bacterium]|jgi:hypothetical protein
MNPLEPFRCIQELVAAGDTEGAMDFLMESLDELMLGGRHQETAKLLEDIAGSDLPISILLLALTGTLPWRVLLMEAREKVAEAVVARMPDSAQRLLQGLVK